MKIEWPLPIVNVCTTDVPRLVEVGDATYRRILDYARKHGLSNGDALKLMLADVAVRS